MPSSPLGEFCSLRIFTIFAAAVSLAACGGEKKAERKAPPPPPVQVTEVRREIVPLEVRAIGNIEPWSAVEVRPRVSGPILRVNFNDGDDVREGQVLFVIDPREYQQAVRQAEAEVESQKAGIGQAEANYQRDLATARNARAQAQRYADLAAKGIISREQNEQFQTQAVAAEKAAAASQALIASARAALQGAQSKLADARLQLSYTSIRAPITGRTGNLTHKAGNLVTANETEPLVVINQLTPIYATFSVPEQSLNELRRFSANGRLGVEVAPAQGDGPAAQGTLNFVDNEVDPATGTIRLKARVPNTDRRLWPGQFVNVSVRLAAPEAVVVPTAAVRNAQTGNYVFVVKSDSTAEQRVVQTERAWRDLTVIAQGVQPGERVITEGQLRVRPGGKVSVRPGGGMPQQSASAGRP